MRRRIAIGGGVLAAAALAAGVAVLGGDDDPGAPAAARASVGDTATVERRDLVDRDEVDGTLGYAGAGTLVAGASGTITSLRAPGAVVERGEALYELDDAPAAFLLYGRLPAWRDFTPWMDDGEDIRQLERNLRALGDDPDGDLTVDDEWDWATTAAVERFQDERGLTEDGSLRAGRGRVPARADADRRGQGDGRPGRVAGAPAGRRVLHRAARDRRPRGDAAAARPQGRHGDGRHADGREPPRADRGGREGRRAPPARRAPTRRSR